MPNLYYHLLVPSAWGFWKDKVSYSPESLAHEGFIHLSLERQLLNSAHRFYIKEPELVVLVIDPGKLVSPVKMEPADNDEFPHLYGSLNSDAIVEVKRLRREKEKFVFA